MPTWGWLIIGVVALVGALVIARIVQWCNKAGAEEKRRAELLQEKGEVVPCLLTMWNDKLDDPTDTSDRNAQAIFSMQSGPDILARLKEIEYTVFECGDGDEATPDERRIAFMCKTHFPLLQPCLIPQRLTGGLEAYSVSLKIKRELLPKKFIEVPVAFAKVAMAGDMRVAEMVEYPPGFDFQAYAHLRDAIVNGDEDNDDDEDESA